MSKQPPPAPTASAVGPCPTIIQIVGRPGTGSLSSTIAQPDHPLCNIGILIRRHIESCRSHNGYGASNESISLNSFIMLLYISLRNVYRKSAFQSIKRATETQTRLSLTKLHILFDYHFQRYVSRTDPQVQTVSILIKHHLEILDPKLK